MIGQLAIPLPSTYGAPVLVRFFGNVGELRSVGAATDSARNGVGDSGVRRCRSDRHRQNTVPIRHHALRESLPFYGQPNVRLCVVSSQLREPGLSCPSRLFCL